AQPSVAKLIDAGLDPIEQTETAQQALDAGLERIAPILLHEVSRHPERRLAEIVPVEALEFALREHPCIAGIFGDQRRKLGVKLHVDKPRLHEIPDQEIVEIAA